MPKIVEREIAWGRRAFPKSQELLRMVPSRRVNGVVDVGWHGTETAPNTGAFAVVAEDGPLADLVGDILRVSANGREAFVYCVGTASVPWSLSLSRRAFLALGSLGLESLSCVVEIA